VFHFDLQLFAQSPSYELTALGVAKETGYAVQAAPTAFLSAQDTDFHGTNAFLERGSARGQVSQELAATGAFTGSGSASLELDGDIAQVILGLTMGSETVTPNPNNPAAPAAVATTIAAGVGYQGQQVVTPASMVNIIVGNLLRVSNGNSDQEDVRVIAVTGTTFTAAFGRVHAAGVALVQTPLALAYDHRFTIGSPRPTATFTWNRKQDCVAFIGNKISSLQISAAANAILLAKIATQYSTEGVAAAFTPSFSEVTPFRFEDAGNLGYVNGAASTAGILSWDATIDTGLIGAEQVFGHGRFTGEAPEGQTKVSGSASLQFESEQMQQAFWGSVGAIGPQSVIAPLSLSFFWQGSDYINAAVQYGITFAFPAVLITEDPTAGRTGGLLQQAVKFSAYQSVSGAADDMVVTLTNGNAASF
jgi:hypothetical protein